VKRLTYRERNKTGRTTRTIPYMVQGRLKTIKYRGESGGRRSNWTPLYSVKSDPSDAGYLVSGSTRQTLSLAWQ
jgi:hypothetical protein